MFQKMAILEVEACRDLSAFFPKFYSKATAALMTQRQQQKHW